MGVIHPYICCNCALTSCLFLVCLLGFCFVLQLREGRPSAGSLQCAQSSQPNSDDFTLGGVELMWLNKSEIFTPYIPVHACIVWYRGVCTCSHVLCWCWTSSSCRRRIEAWRRCPQRGLYGRRGEAGTRRAGTDAAVAAEHTAARRKSS